LTEEHVKGSLAPPAETREVMDIRQAADYLGVSADSLYRYAATGFIPAFRLGNRWRFRKSRLDEWMDRRSGLEENAEQKLVRAQKKPVRSTRVLSRGARTGS
jgi:excisionase family DNA binding protein